VEIRQATEDDLPAVVDLVERAYEPWIERIGRRPAPMDSDYAALIGAGEVHLLDDGGRTVGLVIVRDLGDHLVIDNVAVDPDHQGRGHGRACWRSPSAARPSSASPSSASTPTR
jgi:ribosomal protein S18 acetylase RimI-like enzyme